MNFIGQVVIHNKYGEGILFNIENNIITVKFESFIGKYNADIVFEKEIIRFVKSEINSNFMIYLKQQKEIKQQEHNEQLDKAEQRVAGRRGIISTSHSQKLTADFMHIVRGEIYGTKAQNIYCKFCETLNFDSSKIAKFGILQPLYAENADTKRTSDVWFICYPNYDPNKLENTVADGHVINLIQNYGDKIIEVIDEKYGNSHDANRITFAKTKSGYYEFLGVYKIVQNGTTRIYERISDIYPLEE